MQTVASQPETTQRPRIAVMSCTARRERPLGNCLRMIVTHGENLYLEPIESFHMHDGGQPSQQLLAWDQGAVPWTQCKDQAPVDLTCSALLRRGAQSSVANHRVDEKEASMAPPKAAAASPDVGSQGMVFGAGVALGSVAGALLTYLGALQRH